MLVITQEQHQRLEHKARLFLEAIEAKTVEKALPTLVDLLEPIQAELGIKAERSELKEILLEIRTLREDMNRRFEAVDKRFEDMQQSMDKRFEAMQRYMDKRFEAMDKRFEDMQRSMDKRFEDMQRNTDKRFAMLQWFMGIGFFIISISMPFTTGLLLKFFL